MAVDSQSCYTIFIFHFNGCLRAIDIHCPSPSTQAPHGANTIQNGFQQVNPCLSRKTVIIWLNIKTSGFILYFDLYQESSVLYCYSWITHKKLLTWQRNMKNFISETLLILFLTSVKAHSSWRVNRDSSRLFTCPPSLKANVNYI